MGAFSKVMGHIDDVFDAAKHAMSDVLSWSRWSKSPVLTMDGIVALMLLAHLAGKKLFDLRRFTLALPLR